MSYGTLLDRHYLGIVQNADSQLLSMYIYTDIPDAALREKFIQLGTQWWWGSNRQVPIHIFLKNFHIFRPYLKHFSRKDFNLEAGPVVSLQETIARRVRKRQITLIKRL
jgi:hypothetical protein